MAGISPSLRPPRLLRRAFAAPARLWERLTLFLRLAAVLSTCLGAGAVLIFSLLIRDNIRTNSQELHEQAAREVELLTSLLTEYAILGDYGSIGQTLRRITRQAGIAEAVWRPERGKPLTAAADPVIYPGADLAHRWLALPEPQERRRVVVGGHSYGEVQLQVSARAREKEIVGGIASYIGLLALSSGGMLLCLMIVLRQALDPLRELDARVRGIEAGEVAEELRPQGSPEVRRLIAAFNAMNRSRQASYEELERFAEVLAHHLQEPVRLQYAFAQKLEAQMPAALPDNARTSLGYILKSSLRLRALIRDVQLFLALKHLKPDDTPCSADAAFAAARKELEPKLKTAGALLEVSPLPPLPMAEHRLTDVFRALLDNALEYRHPERPLRIQVRSERNEDRLSVVVCDNGLGIPPEYRERVFKVFERLHTNRDHPGTGIGLSLVRKIVEAAGGRVAVEDGEDGGTALRLTFVFAAQESDGS